MGDLDIYSESILARGWRDTKACLHTWQFLLLEGGGTAVIGIASQDPIVAVLFFFGLFLAFLLGAIGVAPFKQRIEARTALRALSSPPLDPWVSAEDATQMIYDGMTTESLTGELLLRMFNRSSAQGMSMWQQVGVFLAQGINEGIIVAEGARGGRSQPERIPPGMQRHGDAYEFREASGIKWTLHRAERQSIQNFLEKVENDHAENGTE